MDVCSQHQQTWNSSHWSTPWIWQFNVIMQFARALTENHSTSIHKHGYRSLHTLHFLTEGSVSFMSYHHMHCTHIDMVSSLNHASGACTCARVESFCHVQMPTCQDHTQKWSAILTTSPVKHVADLQEVESWWKHVRPECFQEPDVQWIWLSCTVIMCQSLQLQQILSGSFEN